MKKLCALLACVLLTGSLVGCGDAGQTPAESPAPVSTATPVPAATPAATPTAEPTASPTPEPDWEIPSPEEDPWAYQGYTLTCQIVEYCLQPFEGTLDIDTLSDEEIFNFLWSMEQNTKDQYYPYRDDVTIVFSEDGSDFFAHLPEQNAQKIVYQLFGVEDWARHDAEVYDAAVPEYRFDMTEPGPEQHFFCWYVSAEQTGDTVTVPFHLYGVQTVVDTTGQHQKEYGAYEATYTVMTENGRSFLRFAGIHPAE